MKRFPRLDGVDLSKRVVINVRGTNGSGKSTVAFKLMEKFGATPLLDETGAPWAYKVHYETPVYLLGSYETATGGCDMISTMPGVELGVRMLLQRGNVLFEGILVSLITKRWIKLAQSLPEVKFIFGTLSTPARTCVRQVIKRRIKEDNNHNEYNPKGLLLKYQAVHRGKKILKEAGMDSRRLSHEKPMLSIITWLLEGEYKPEDAK